MIHLFLPPRLPSTSPVTSSEPLPWPPPQNTHTSGFDLSHVGFSVNLLFSSFYNVLKEHTKTRNALELFGSYLKQILALKSDCGLSHEHDSDGRL